MKPEVGGFLGSNEGCSVFGGEGRASVWPRVQAFYLLVEGEENGGGGNGLELVRGSVCGRLETRKRRPTGGAELLIFSRKRGIKKMVVGQGERLVSGKEKKSLGCPSLQYSKMQKYCFGFKIGPLIFFFCKI